MEFDKLDTQKPESAKSNQFSYDGETLTWSGYSRADNKSLRRLMKTQQVPNGIAYSKGDKQNWWTAQVRLRGLV
jgi:hypothetical protein